MVGMENMVEGGYGGMGAMKRGYAIKYFKPK